MSERGDISPREAPGGQRQAPDSAHSNFKLIKVKLKSFLNELDFNCLKLVLLALVWNALHAL